MPDSMVASVINASASLSTQHIANVEIDGRSYPINLQNFLVSQKSGERKNKNFNELKRVLKSLFISGKKRLKR